MSEEQAKYEIDKVAEIKKQIEEGELFTPNEVRWLLSELEQAQGKIKSLNTQLDAKLVFINNGWEEERYALQDQLQSAQQEMERLKIALHTHESYDMTVSEMHEREQKLIEGLQMAFDLLEEHEPTWYLMGHYNKFLELGVTE